METYVSEGSYDRHVFPGYTSLSRYSSGLEGLHVISKRYVEGLRYNVLTWPDPTADKIINTTMTPWLVRGVIVEIRPQARDQMAKPEWMMAYGRINQWPQSGVRTERLTRYRPVLLTVTPYSVCQRSKTMNEVRSQLTANQLTITCPPRTGIKNRPAWIGV